jgi:uncharacterized protein
MPRTVLGAPGVYRLQDERIRSLTGVRMDVCAFAGVAPRGPARAPVLHAAWAEPPCGARLAGGPASVHAVPVAVESWDAYRRVFGGFEGPGLLPYAVASFFENGGRRAWVARIVHRYDDARDDEGVAASELSGVRDGAGRPLLLRARSEGAWGNRLRVRLGFRTDPLVFDAASPQQLALPPDTQLPPGTLLRLTLPGGTQVLRFVTSVSDEWEPARGTRTRRAQLELATPAAATAAEVVAAELVVGDGDGRAEYHDGLGLAPDHPRWLAAVLHQESLLLRPDQRWIHDALAVADTRLAGVGMDSPFAGGLDRYADITPADFFDELWTPGAECPGRGVHAFAELADVAMLVVPDLYSPGALAPTESVADPPSLAGPTFERCVTVAAPAAAAPPPQELDGLLLDPEQPADLEEIVRHQRRLVELAELLRSFVVLLDVPPRLDQPRTLQWRGRFGSAFAAAYHPWLAVARADDGRAGLVRVNPAGAAAGLIAAREHAHGITYGPANELAAGVVDVAERVAPQRHDVLHQAGINVFLRDRDGVRLTAARTLARTPEYRQLSVRRLMTMLQRSVEQQMQWTVFEPNHEPLRADVRHVLRSFLRQLYRANAFTGAREEDAFFVRCDAELNPPAVVDACRLVVEIGVAPAEPTEFIVLRIARGDDGTFGLEA